MLKIFLIRTLNSLPTNALQQIRVATRTLNVVEIRPPPLKRKNQFCRNLPSLIKKPYLDFILLIARKGFTSTDKYLIIINNELNQL